MLECRKQARSRRQQNRKGTGSEMMKVLEHYVKKSRSVFQSDRKTLKVLRRGILFCFLKYY